MDSPRWTWKRGSWPKSKEAPIRYQPFHPVPGGRDGGTPNRLPSARQCGPPASRPCGSGASRYPWQNDSMRLTPSRRYTTCAGAALAGAVLASVLSGCVAGPSAGPAVKETTGSQQLSASPAAGTTAPPQPGQAADQVPQSAGASAQPLADTSGGASAAAAAATEKVKVTVTDALTRLAAGAPKPATAQVSDALTGAGIAASQLQVSQSRTPTGLEADAIEAAVLQGRDCVIGQVREGAVTVTVLPVLASGKCFVGS